MGTCRTLRQQLADLQRRYAEAIDQRDEADRLRSKAGGPSPSEELRDARRALMLSERARRALDEQLVTVQAANEQMCREAVDRAGTLTRQGVTG